MTTGCADSRLRQGRVYEVAVGPACTDSPTVLTAAGNDLTKAKAAVAECLTAENQYEASLGASQWGSVQPQVDDVIKAMGSEQVVLTELSTAATAADFTADAPQLTTAEGNLQGAVNVLRSALGLPPAQSTAS
jgi:hypothetical protein